MLGLGGIVQQLPVKSSNECESEEKQSGVNRSRSSLSLCFVTTVLEKPNFYRDFELLLGLGGIVQQLPVKSSNECESEEKQSGVNRSRSSLSLCFVTLEGF
uniref:hypothetical protein n=1 Tax=Fluviicola sp. TaxID=1917219 RepID=UPI00404B0E15